MDTSNAPQVIAKHFPLQMISRESVQICWVKCTRFLVTVVEHVLNELVKVLQTLENLRWVCVGLSLCNGNVCLWSKYIKKPIYLQSKRLRRRAHWTSLQPPCGPCGRGPQGFRHNPRALSTHGVAQTSSRTAVGWDLRKWPLKWPLLGRKKCWRVFDSDEHVPPASLIMIQASGWKYIRRIGWNILPTGVLNTFPCAEIGQSCKVILVNSQQRCRN